MSLRRFFPARRPLLVWLLVLTGAVAGSATADSVPETAVEFPAPPPISSRAWLLAEFGSGQILASANPDQRIAPAALTGIATALVVFRAIRDDGLSPTKTISAPEDITAGGGARMFLEPGMNATVDQLLYGLIVQSGRDAARLLAETVAGDEAAFVERMNALAKSLALQGTHFANADGRSQDDHYSTPRDLMTLSATLVREFPEAYARYFAEKRYTYNTITQINRNRLLWVDPTVDGLKTARAGEERSLIASSRRGGRRLIAVVIGADDDDTRSAEALSLLNWGFQRFESLRLYGAGETIARFPVWYGASDEVNVGIPEQDLTIAVPRGADRQLSAELVSRQPISAPIAAGQELGRIRLSLAGTEWGEYPVYSLETVPAAGLLGRLADRFRFWLNN